MRRLLLCAFALMGGFALSCQVFPAAQAPLPQGSGTLPLPSVAGAPPSLDLAATLAQVEGHAVAVKTPRQASIQRVAEHMRGRHTGLSAREIDQVARTIVDECAAQDLEVSLVMAVIQVESAGYHRAVSHVGARGLMQIMPETGEQLARQQGMEWYGAQTLFDPIVNVRLGIAYLRELADRYDHVPTALAAYNWGPGRIDRRIRRGAKMPQLYIEQVMRAYDRVEEPLTGRI